MKGRVRLTVNHGIFSPAIEKDINENIAQKETNLLKNSPLIK